MHAGPAVTAHVISLLALTGMFFFFPSGTEYWSSSRHELLMHLLPPRCPLEAGGDLIAVVSRVQQTTLQTPATSGPRADLRLAAWCRGTRAAVSQRERVASCYQGLSVRSEAAQRSAQSVNTVFDLCVRCFVSCNSNTLCSHS